MILALCLSLLCVACGDAPDASEESADTPVYDNSEETEEKDDESEGEGKDSEENLESLDFMPLEFTFSSGVGAWSTVMTVNPDGSFSGEYYDSEMSEASEDYPEGTVYVSKFSGEFTDIKKVDEYTYSLTLKDVSTENPVGDEWIEDNIRYVAAEPSGLDSGKTFLLYMPGTPIKDLDEDFLYWYQGDTTLPELEDYGLYNVDDSVGFFAY